MESLLSTLRKECENNSIRITSGIDFHYDGATKTIRMVMKDGIKKNMQEDAVAFEAWALALKANLGDLVDYIELDWKLEKKLTKTERRHFHRFLYRVDTFSKLYSNWFRVISNETSWEKETKNNGWEHLVLNSQGERGIFELEEFDADSEHDLEVYFATAGSEKLKKAVKDQFNIELGDIKNQYPVGIFKNEVKEENYIFTGGKSAIDLYSIANDNSFNLFELKGDKNVKVGILSELFFYSSLISDAIDGKFKSESEELNQLDKVNAFFLVSKMHPLITDKVIEILNEPVNNIAYKKLIYLTNDIHFPKE